MPQFLSLEAQSLLRMLFKRNPANRLGEGCTKSRLCGVVAGPLRPVNGLADAGIRRPEKRVNVLILRPACQVNST